MMLDRDNNILKTRVVISDRVLIISLRDLYLKYLALPIYKEPLSP